MIQGARIDTLSRTDIIFNKYSEGVACGKTISHIWEFKRI